MIGDEFLRLLRCPISRLPLEPADDRLVARVNQAISAGQISDRGGEPVDRPLDEGLVSQDRAWLYPVNDGIPTLMAESAIALDQLSGWPTSEPESAGQ